MKIQPIGQAAARKLIAVFCEAFRDYPVMRFVAGPGEFYAERLEELIGLFVAGRSFRGHPKLGVCNAEGELAAAITMTPRGPHPMPDDLVTFGEAVWGRLGVAARQRYDAMTRAWSLMPQLDGYWHVNMLGVRDADRGKGHAGRLLQAACDRAHADPFCRGVELTTEDPANLAYYEERGFKVVGHARVDEGPETWMLTRDFR